MAKEMVTNDKAQFLPILPLKNVVLLPRAVIAIKATRDLSIAAVNKAMTAFAGKIFVVTQIDPTVTDISIQHLPTFGILANLLEVTTEADGSLKLLVEGLNRAKILNFSTNEAALNNYFSAEYSLIQSVYPDEVTTAVYIKNIKQSFKELVNFSPDKYAQNAVKLVKMAKDLDEILNAVANVVDLDADIKKFLLENAELELCADKILSSLQCEINFCKTDKNIKKRVQSQVDKHQKDYYLNEQVRAIYKEMGKDDILAEVDKFKEQAKKLKLSKDAFEKLSIECKRLEQMQPAAPEATVCRTYIEWLLAVPWFGSTKDNVSLATAKAILDESHAGIKKVKDSILEFVAAKKFAKDNLKTSPVICLLGPPGVGKTTLVSSIAKALGRKFVRISLGGLRDEAEIRGHRRTYIGAMPGKIVSAMRNVGVQNPVILLDEIDKMSSDFRGDPASALLEVLDMEQNKNFSDHFLEVGYDLSKVIFVATANLSENIPFPLLDRMDLISLSGYTENEKLDIAVRFLVPKILEEHAIKKDQVSFSENILKKIISEYTREAGVRSLTRILTKIVRKAIVILLDKKVDQVEITEELVLDWLGYQRFKNNETGKKDLLGVATGLAWTEVGGDTLDVEVVKLKGKGSLTITGQLGEVMQESAQASLSCIRTRAKQLGLKEGFYANFDLHIHIPEGATPKDGPSAGITMATAIASVITGIAVKKDVAISGEITLQGRVLGVGGLKEKILAAVRAKSKLIILPKENEDEVLEIQKELKLDVEIKFVEILDEVLKLALVKNPFLLTSKKGIKKENAKPKEKSKSPSRKSRAVIPSVRARAKKSSLLAIKQVVRSLGLQS